MNEKLIKQFKHAIVTNKTEEHESIIWLEDETRQPVGFLTDQLTESELLLLTMLFQPVVSTPKPQGSNEEHWAHFLLAKGDQPRDPKIIRMIHFTLDKRIDDLDSFRDVWNNILDGPVIIVWTSSTRGLIILDTTMEEELPDFISINQAIASDFYIDMTLLVGSSHEIEHAKEQFRWESACLDALIKAKVIHRVFYEYEAIPYLLLEPITFELREQFINRLLDEELRSDKDFLKSMKVYFEHNLNISAAAKALHLHRNSLQYRIDKFTERTNFDLRQFTHASLLYLALLLLDTRS
ncbi:CdaR family transcriptional regulator [Halalkalibacter sp. APA_J-10(15)]|uniref:PucR family transcriptional regulator n=1 Tax=Halalkalibacter sp. APA_J-10(15) TaxID=2933805 RepID=UPI001FF63499|nr:helix-turn-helix domain-containing protein [Halalkalibacter sp. APA_J-10(15)]MCK0470318.1 helix-turn-helix domain-containing protein [Halalkalibacter sp. APA_J-10(15)]